MRTPCTKVTPPEGYGPCVREAGHDGPCGHPPAEPTNMLEALTTWMRVPVERREFVLLGLVENIQHLGKVADEADRIGLTALAAHYRENLSALELAAHLLGFAPRKSGK